MINTAAGYGGPPLSHQPCLQAPCTTLGALLGCGLLLQDDIVQGDVVHHARAVGLCSGWLCVDEWASVCARMGVGSDVEFDVVYGDTCMW